MNRAQAEIATAAPGVIDASRSLRRRSLSRGRTSMLVGADAVALAAALAITYGVAEALAPPSIIAPDWLIVLLALLALPVWIAIFTIYNLYERQNRSISLATFDEVGELFHALLAGSLLLLLLEPGAEALDRCRGLLPGRGRDVPGHRAAAGAPAARIDTELRVPGRHAARAAR